MLLLRLATTYSALLLPLFVIPVSCATSIAGATFTYTISNSVYSLALPPTSSLAPESTAEPRSVSATPLIATTAPNAPEVTSQGVLVIPIVLGGTTYINTIPVSEVNPVVVPSSAALVVATAVTGASSVSAFPLGPGLISVSSSPQSPTSIIEPSGTTTAIAGSSAQSLTSAASSSEPTSSFEPSQSAQSSLSSATTITAPTPSDSSAPSTGLSISSANTASETASTQTSLPSTTSASATRGILSTLSSVAGTATSSRGSSRSQAGAAPQNTDAPPSNGDSGAVHIHGKPGGSYACWTLAAAIAAAWSLL